MSRTPWNRLVWTAVGGVLLLSSGSALAAADGPSVDASVKITLLESNTQSAVVTVAVDRPNAANGPKHIEYSPHAIFTRGQAETQETHTLSLEPGGDLAIEHQDTAFDRFVNRNIEQPVDDVCAALGERC